MTDFAAARHNMVESQIRTNKVIDEALIAAFRKVPRESFVPKSMRGIAYVDEDLPVAPGRFLIEPMVLARLVQALDLSPDDTVLDVACATGYSTVILSHRAGSVVGLESDKVLVDQANATLAALQIDNAAVVAGPIEQGYADEAPFSAILVNGAIEAPPEALLAQLAEGGRLACVMRPPTSVSGGAIPGAAVGRATVFLRTSAGVSKREIFDAGTPVLPAFRRARGFVF